MNWIKQLNAPLGQGGSGINVSFLCVIFFIHETSFQKYLSCYVLANNAMNYARPLSGTTLYGGNDQPG